MLNYLKNIRENRRQKQFYNSLINTSDLCFDIGANLGFKSKIFLSLGAKVIAIEPQSSCIKELKKIKNNNFKCFQFAVGSKNEEKELQLANHVEVATFSQSFIDYFETEDLKWTKTETVKVKTLDSLIEDHGTPDFCKIDIEGYELEVLSALTKSIPLIEFEFTGGFITETIEILNLFKNDSYKFNYNLNEKPKFEISEWISSQKMIDIINSLQKERLHGNIFVKSK
jgi:FkbM family methyltransferase